MKTDFLLSLFFIIFSLPAFAYVKESANSKNTSSSDLVIVEGSLLKALKNETILKEAQALPEQKPLQTPCFRIVNIKKESRLNDLKIRKDDCISSIKSYKKAADDKSLTTEEVFLSSSQEMLKIIPLLKNAVRVETDLLRHGQKVHLIYLVKEGAGEFKTKPVSDK